jgi:outer membrane protein TolC
LAQQQARLRGDLAALVRQRANQGLASDFDANRAEAAHAATLATLPPLRQAIEVDIDRLGVLTGEATGRGWSACAKRPPSPPRSIRRWMPIPPR